MRSPRDLVADRSLRVGIIGMGYVGIPLALRFSETGFRVIGLDVDEERVSLLNAGKSAIQHIPDRRIAQMREAGFEAVLEPERIGDLDVIIICVPTPLDEYREPDLSFVVSTMKMITPHLRAGQLLSLESTSWPGTTDEILKPFIEERGLTPGEDFFLVYSPEREDPGNADYTVQQIPKILGGCSTACRDQGVAVYGAIVDQVVPVSSTRVAEMTKLLENIHRAVNIGLVNELKMVADRMGIDIFEVVSAAATKPFGFTPYYPGPGLGGHCIPVDPFYLTWKARELGLHTRFIELAGEINARMPQYVVEKIVQALNSRGTALSNARILALGIAYKPDVDDTRESPAVEVMEILRRWDAEVHYSDPNVPSFPKMRKHRFDLDSVTLTAKTVSGYDAVVLLTHHRDFDYGLILEHARLIIDTRGVYREPHPNVVAA